MTDSEFEALETRVKALEDILQGGGSYTSKYGGEEIDRFLEWVSQQMGGGTA